MTKEELDNQLRSILHMLLQVNDALGDALRASDKLIERVRDVRAAAQDDRADDIETYLKGGN
jgi:hypothetical protein